MVESESRFCDALCSALLRGGLCCSTEEAAAVAEVIMADMKERGISQLELATGMNTLSASLQENLDLSPDEANSVSRRIYGDLEEHDSNNNAGPSEASLFEGGDHGDDGVALFDGECELCDRYIKLTKHHLIPKSTWPRMMPRLQHAGEAMDEQNVDKAHAILGPGLLHLAQELTGNKRDLRQILHRTCDICRPCHSAVHRAHSNLDLALDYNTVELILQDEKITNHCKWMSKQRAGKHSLRY